MSYPAQNNYELALRDFERARQQAALQQILARVRGESTALLCYDAVRQQLRASETVTERGLQEIPLDKIVGSVGRYEDFTRSFLPKRDSDKERWAGVRAAVDAMVGMPPIEVYQLGDAYFVQDGNHRVSVARQLGTPTISAYVTEVKTRVPLTPDDDPNEILCKSFYADFLEKTNLDKLRPGLNLLMTFTGQYQVLLEQIEAEHSLLKSTSPVADVEALWEQAVVDWYDHVYLPVVQIIRSLGVLHRFPDRTEADLYVLLSERHDELEAALGWQVEMETAVTDLLTPQEESVGLFDRLLRTVAPSFDPGPEPGLWRQQQLARHRDHHLFEYILVALDGTDESWQLFERTVWMARFDRDHLLGLHVVAENSQIDSEAVQHMRTRFEQRCQDAGLEGAFAVEVDSSPARAIVKRAAWADLVMVNDSYSPHNEPLARLSPGLKLLVQQCPRPIEVVPRGNSQTDDSLWSDRLLLAYDGSSKADEALFVAAYLTARWQRSLTVVTVETAHTDVSRLEQAEQYLRQRGLNDVTYVLEKGPIAEKVLETANVYRSQLLIMGGFSFRPVRHLVLGSTAERLLREFRQPMLICR